MKSSFKPHLCMFTSAPRKRAKGLELQYLGFVAFSFPSIFLIYCSPSKKMLPKEIFCIFSGFAQSFLLVWQVQRSLSDINFLSHFHASVCIEFFQQDIPYFPKFPANRTLTLPCTPGCSSYQRCICSKRFFWVIPRDGIRWNKKSG